MNGVKNTRKLIISKVKIFGENVEPIVTDFFKGLNIPELFIGFQKTP